jgi:hypothetical protein
MSQDALDAATAGAVATAASKVTYGGSAAAVGGWFLSNEFAVLAGLVIGLAGFAVNWYYRHREFKLREREHNKRMAEQDDHIALMKKTLESQFPRLDRND